MCSFAMINQTVLQKEDNNNNDDDDDDDDDDNDNNSNKNKNNNNNERISRALFHVKHAQLC